MSPYIFSFLLIISLISCNSLKNHSKMTNQKEQSEKDGPQILEPKVIGIGGIFFFSDNPKETREWYHKNLGLVVNDYGSTFEFRNADRPEELNYLQWSPFKTGTDYFKPSTKEFMVNYRVQNIEGLVSKLKENGIKILDDIATYDYGKFVHILDVDGNKIELWEPVVKDPANALKNTTK